MTMRAFSPRSSMPRTLPSSSMMPVNILTSEPKDQRQDKTNAERREVHRRHPLRLALERKPPRFESRSCRLLSGSSLQWLFSHSPDPFHHLCEDLVDVLSRRIDDDGIVRDLQWRICTRGVALVTFS